VTPVLVSYCCNQRTWRAHVVIPRESSEYPSMSRCPYCGSDLSSFQTLCSKCYDSTYSKLDRRGSLLRSVWRYVANPLGITEESVSEVRVPGAIVCLAVGVSACWFAGYAKLGYAYALFSNAVFAGGALILVKSAVLSLVISAFLARKNLRMYLEVSLGAFAAVSLCYARWAWHVGVFQNTLRHIGSR
jgi:hypothetical protein